VDWGQGLVCTSDPHFGAVLFRYADQTKVRSFEVRREMPGNAYPMDVRFGENGSTIVTGSDHGVVYIFETGLGETLQKLDTGREKRIRAIAVSDPAILQEPRLTSHQDDRHRGCTRDIRRPRVHRRRVPGDLVLEARPAACHRVGQGGGAFQGARGVGMRSLRLPEFGGEWIDPQRLAGRRDAIHGSVGGDGVVVHGGRGASGLIPLVDEQLAIEVVNA
jgi:hypothetical protein